MNITFHRKLRLFLTLGLVLLLASCGPTDPASSNGNTSSSGSAPATSDMSSAEEPPVEAQFRVEAKARCTTADDSTWQTTLEATNGKVLELQIQYVNLDTATHDEVNISVDLPEEFTYIEGSTKLYNTEHPNGAQVNQDDITTDEGIYLGSYIGRQGDAEAGANAYVRLSFSINSDTYPGSHTITIFTHARRADQTDYTSDVQMFYISTPLVSMP